MKVPEVAYTTPRITGDAFKISTWLMFGLVVIAVAARILIQIHHRRPVGVDDVFLFFAFASLLSSMVVMQLKVFDRMYLVWSVQYAVEGVLIPADMINIGFQFHKWVTISLELGWLTITLVKFSFLFFFKKLINRIRPLYIFWWFVMVYTCAVFVYGVTIYYFTCPWFFKLKSMTCHVGDSKRMLVRHSVAQISLDIIGDAFILVIPIAVVWKMKVSATQKFALGFSLCLTICLVVITIVRGTGIEKDEQVDHIWEVYWHIISGQVGVFMAAAIAFRSFFVMRSKKKSNANMSPQTEARNFFKQSFMKRMHRRGQYSLDDSMDEKKDTSGLPGIPRAYMTGMRTYIDGRGQTSAGPSMHGSTLVSSHDGTLKGNDEDDDLVYANRPPKPSQQV